jgi:hypothetical protein
VVVYRPQNGGQNHNITIGKMFFERVEELKCLMTTMTNQNSIHEEIKRGFNLGNAIFQCRIFCFPVCCPKI